MVKSSRKKRNSLKGGENNKNPSVKVNDDGNVEICFNYNKSEMDADVTARSDVGTEQSTTTSDAADNPRLGDDNSIQVLFRTPENPISIGSVPVNIPIYREGKYEFSDLDQLKNSIIEATEQKISEGRFTDRNAETIRNILSNLYIIKYDGRTNPNPNQDEITIEQVKKLKPGDRLDAYADPKISSTVTESQNPEGESGGGYKRKRSTKRNPRKPRKSRQVKRTKRSRKSFKKPKKNNKKTKRR